jgi:hypothetical protein
VAISTAAAKFGTSSVRLAGSGNLALGTYSDYDFGTDDFTIEMWVNWVSTGYTIILDKYTGHGAGGSWALYMNGTQLQWYSTAASTVTHSTVMTAGTWYHIAVCRSGGASGTIYLSVNGNVQSFSGASENYSTNYPLYVGHAGGGYFDGYVDELRVTRGVARYTTSFTPPSTAFSSSITPDNYVAWSWKKGVAPGFDIVTFTGTGASRAIAHSLGAAPAFIIIKQRSADGPFSGATNWRCYHKSIGASKLLQLNLTTQAVSDSTMFNNTEPTGAVFSLGTDNMLNNTGSAYIAYLWAEVPGFSKFDSYTGNGSADGPFVYCGFKPRWVMVKASTATSGWYIIDRARSSVNVANLELSANIADAEYTRTSSLGCQVDFLANGFKLRSSDSGNGSGFPYIFVAFAEAPFKYANAR